MIVPSDLSTTQWNQLVTRIGALPAPKVAAKPNSSAIKDPNAPQPDVDRGPARGGGCPLGGSLDP